MNIKSNYQTKISTRNTNVVSFSRKDTIPFRLESKFQDEFHLTGQQIRIRHYLEFKEKGLSDEEIATKMFAPRDNREETAEEKQVKIDYIKKLGAKIKETDESFKKTIPSLFPKTYYRGIVESDDNRAIKIINESQIGDIIKPDLGYPFLASKMSYAESYSRYVNGQSSPKNCIVMIIKTPSGTPISRDISFNSILGDKNVVLARGANYKVLNKEIKNNRTYITLEYLSCANDE